MIKLVCPGLPVDHGDEVPEAVAQLRRVLAEYETNARHGLHALRRSALVGVANQSTETPDEKNKPRANAI